MPLSCASHVQGKGNYGFAEFEDRTEAKAAMLHMHGMKFSGERLGVDVGPSRKSAPSV